MKQVAQNYRSGELAVLDVPVPACKPGRRAGALAVLADLHRHRDDEGQRGPDVAARQGPGPARPGPQAARLGGPAGPARHLQEGDDRLDSYTPLGYSLCGVVVEVGAGAEEFAVAIRELNQVT